MDEQVITVEVDSSPAKLYYRARVDFGRAPVRIKRVEIRRYDVTEYE